MRRSVSHLAQVKEDDVRKTRSRQRQDKRFGGRLARAAAWSALPCLAGCGQPPAPGAAAAKVENLVTVRTAPDVAQVAPGETFHVVAVFEIEPGWHIYWKSPGAGAMAPRVKLDAPPGFAVGQTLWPRPSVVDSPLGPEYSYHEQVALFVPVTAPPQLGDGRVTLNAHIDWAVCSNVCRLGSAQQAVVVETTARPASAPPPDDPVVEKYRRRLPRSLQRTEGAVVSFDGDTLLLRGPAHGMKEATFLPDECPGVVYGEAATTVNGDRFEVRVPVDLEPHNALGEPMVLRGLVALGRELDDPCYDFEVDAGSDRDEE
jgi:DsbC/DsbD-like thiol-disulfide interchange protein